MSVSALKLCSIFSPSKLPNTDKLTSWNGCVHATIPARCLQASEKPQSLAPGTQSLKLKYHDILISPSLSQLVSFAIHLQSDHASSGSVCKGYSSGCNIWIALRFLCTHLIILTEPVCPLFGSVHTVKAITAYTGVKIVDLRAVLQFLSALSSGRNPEKSVTETCFGVKPEILLSTNIS